MVEWLRATCPQSVALASQGERPRLATVYLAPEGRHLVVTQSGTLGLSLAPPRRGFRPSANVLFESVAESHGPLAVGIVLTGMGDDGAEGMAALRAVGATTIAQDEASSGIASMPLAAAASAAQVLPLAAIGPALRRLTQLAPLEGERSSGRGG
jgi:two-component system chemotaxis response regulator CheB